MLSPQTAVTNHAVKTTPLRIDLPRPVSTGTPWPYPSHVPNLEKKTEAKSPVIMVPKGTVNLAAEQVVTSSDPEPVIGELSQITDGNKETFSGCYVELAPGRQWIQIDLGISAKIYALAIWRRHYGLHVYRDVIVQVSNDSTFKANVTTIYNNDHDNSSRMGVGQDKAYIETFMGKLIDAKRAAGRYVRIFSNGSQVDEFNHYVEVEVYGTPAKVAVTPATPLKPKPAKHMIPD